MQGARTIRQRSGWIVCIALVVATVVGIAAVADRLVSMERADYANQVSSFARYVGQHVDRGQALDSRALSELSKVYLLSTNFHCARVSLGGEVTAQWPAQCYAETAGRDDMFRYSLSLSGGTALDVFVARSTVYAEVARTNLAGLVGLAALALSIGLVFQQRQKRLLRRAYQRQEAATVRLDAILSNLAECVITLDASGTILSANPAAEKTFGGSPVGLSINRLIAVDGMPSLSAMFGSMSLCYAHEMLGKRVDVEANRIGGASFPADLTVDIAETPGGKIFVAVIRDVSEQKRRETVLYQAVQEAEQAMAVKSGFVATVSHELRTPLNGILGLLGVMDRAGLSQANRGRIEEALRSGQSLLRIVNDLLDFSKIEKDRLDIEQTPFEVTELFDDVLSYLRPQAEEKGLPLRSELDPALPAVLVGDRHRIGQVLSNLIGNAIKFSDEGCVRATVSVVGTNCGRARVRFAVKDDGCGIAAEDQERIFEEFTCLTPSYNRETTGTGLGLPIARKIVGLMQGEMGLTSAVGEGSEFWFDLCLEIGGPDRTVAAAESAQEAPVAATVLVIDRSPTSRLITAEILTSQGFGVVQADGADEALQALAGTAVDLVVLDTSLCDGDRSVLPGALSTPDGAGGRVAVLGLTADRSAAAMSRLRDAGFDRVLAKPYEYKALTDAVVALLADRDGATSLRAAVS